MGKRKGGVKSLPFLFLGYQVEVCYMISIDHLQVTPPSQFKIQQVRGWVVSLFERGIVYWPNAEITEYPVPI